MTVISLGNIKLITMRRSSIQLRQKPDNVDKKRSRSLSLSKCDTKEYERERKRRQRENKKVGKENVKRGRKETISIKSMTPEEKREYERNRKALQRQKNLLSKKSNKDTNEKDGIVDEASKSNEDEENKFVDESSGIEFEINTEATAIINIITSSPVKKKKSE